MLGFVVADEESFKNFGLQKAFKVQVPGMFFFGEALELFSVSANSITSFIMQKLI
jgi:hypothetical protein